MAFMPSRMLASFRCSEREAVASVMAAASLNTSSKASTLGQAQFLFQVFPANFFPRVHLGMALRQLYPIGVRVGAQPTSKKGHRFHHLIARELLHLRSDFGKNHDARRMVRSGSVRKLGLFNGSNRDLDVELTEVTKMSLLFANLPERIDVVSNHMDSLQMMPNGGQVLEIFDQPFAI